jgi:fibronectin type 3 domain-containing protein
MQFIVMIRASRQKYTHKLAMGGLFVLLCFTGVGCGVLGGEEDTSAPSAPSGLEAESGDERVSLSWEEVDADDIAGYNVYRSTSAIDTLASAESVGQKQMADTSFADPSVENGTVYHYRVTAVDNSDNESDPSGEIQARPFPAPPDRP